MLILSFHAYPALANQTQIINPVPGSDITAQSVQIEWLPDAQALMFVLLVGTTPGGSDLSTQTISGAVNSATVTLPESTDAVHVTLYTHAMTGFYSINHAYATAFNQTPSNPMTIINPMAGSTLTNQSVQLDWQWHGSIHPSQFVVYVGSASGSSDIFAQQLSGGVRSIQLPLPLNGLPIHIRLDAYVGYADSDAGIEHYTISTTYETINNPDTDDDGVPDASDACSETPIGSSVNVEGCALSQLDSDNDGVNDDIDQCAETASGTDVNVEGCPYDQMDSDSDGIPDYMDSYPFQSSAECQL